MRGRKSTEWDDDLFLVLAVGILWILGFIVYPIILKAIVATTPTIWTFNQSPRIFGIGLFVLLLFVTEVVYMSKKIGANKGSVTRKYYSSVISMCIVYPIYATVVFLYDKLIVNLDATRHNWAERATALKQFFGDTWILWIAITVIIVFFAVNVLWENHRRQTTKKTKEKSKQKNKKKEE